jgi:hypothetical protein
MDSRDVALVEQHLRAVGELHLLAELRDQVGTARARQVGVAGVAAVGGEELLAQVARALAGDGAREPALVVLRLHHVDRAAHMRECSVPQYSAQNRWYSPGLVAWNQTVL